MRQGKDKGFKDAIEMPMGESAKGRPEWDELDARAKVEMIASTVDDDKCAALTTRFATEQMTFMRKRARAEAARLGLQPHVRFRAVEDLTQELAVLLLTMVRQERERPGRYTGLGYTWESVFSQKAHNVARSWADGSGLQDVSGRAGAARRYRYLSQRRDELAQELGREPSKAEVVAYANTHAAQHRKDARRQGLVFTEADLVPPVATPYLPESMAETMPDSSTPLVDIEGREFARAIAEEASRQSPYLGEIACTWVGPILCGRSAGPMEWDAVRAAHGLNRAQIEAVRTELRSIVADVEGPHSHGGAA